MPLVRLPASEIVFGPRWRVWYHTRPVRCRLSLREDSWKLEISQALGKDVGQSQTSNKSDLLFLQMGPTTGLGRTMRTLVSPAPLERAFAVVRLQQQNHMSAILERWDIDPLLAIASRTDHGRVLHIEGPIEESAFAFPGTPAIWVSKFGSFFIRYVFQHFGRPRSKHLNLICRGLMRRDPQLPEGESLGPMRSERGRYSSAAASNRLHLDDTAGAIAR